MVINTPQRLRLDIGFFLKSSRRSKSLSGSELGRMLNLSQQQISRYERGVHPINIEMLHCFLIALDKNWSDFFYSVLLDESEKSIYRLIDVDFKL